MLVSSYRVKMNKIDNKDFSETYWHKRKDCSVVRTRAVKLSNDIVQLLQIIICIDSPLFASQKIYSTVFDSALENQNS